MKDPLKKKKSNLKVIYHSNLVGLDITIAGPNEWKITPDLIHTEITRGRSGRSCISFKGRSLVSSQRSVGSCTWSLLPEIVVLNKFSLKRYFSLSKHVQVQVSTKIHFYSMISILPCWLHPNLKLFLVRIHTGVTV